MYNRVMMILRLFEWTTGRKSIPLFHIDGTANLTDLLTKKHKIKVEDVSSGSDWIEGLQWMRLPSSETSYEDLSLNKGVRGGQKIVY